MPVGKYIKSLVSKTRSPKQYLPDSLNELRVLHIGGYSFRGLNSPVRHIMLGLKDAGVQVLEYNTDEHPDALDTEGRSYDSGTYGPVWIREEYLREHIDNSKPHIIVFNAGGLSFKSEVSRRLRSSVYLLGIALSDPDVFSHATSRIAPNFDLFLTNDPTLLPKYRELGANVAALPLGTNEKFFRPLPAIEKYRTDVLIIGRCLPNRIEPVKAILKHFDTVVYGEGWEEYGIPSRGTIYGDDLMHALNSARIAPVFLQNPDDSSIFVKIAILDFPSAGALVITNYLPDVEDYLTFGKEIIGFTSTEDLIAKIEYYLSRPEEAEAIRKAGHERIRQEHTWVRVWPRILSQLTGRLIKGNLYGG
jgi:spore maturation protein CgeB